MAEIYTFEEAVDKYGNSVLKTAYIYLRDRDKADDIYQEVFIKLYTHKVQFESNEHLKAWLLRVTINASINYLKSHWHKKTVEYEPNEMIPNSDNTESTVCKAEEVTQILNAVMSLKIQFREVILLYYYEEYTIPEISQILNTPEGTVKTRLMRAKDKLKKILKGGYFSDENVY